MNLTFYDILVPLIGGMFLGLVFFAGLRLTTTRLLHSTRPALLATASLAVRILILLVGIWYLGAGQWERYLLCLLGIMVARYGLLFFLARFGPDAEESTSASEGTDG